MDKAQLLPCPFCGGAAGIVAVGRDWWRLTVEHTDECYFGDGHDRDVPQTAESHAWLVENWNGRAPQPPSASGERDAFEAWAAERNYRLSPDQNNCGIVVPERYGHPTVQRMWEAWQARAALAPSPGIDAAGQKPIPLNVIRKWPDGLEDAVGATMLDTVGYTLNYRLYDLQQALSKFGFTMTVTEAAPPAAQPDAAWLAEADRLAEDLRKEAMRAGALVGSNQLARDAKAALLAHLKARP